MIKIGDRVLTPDLYAGILEEIDQSDGMARVRHIAFDGGPSVLSTWYNDISVLKILPLGFVNPQPTVEEKAKAVIFYSQIEEIAESFLDD